jgi:TonB family protein
METSHEIIDRSRLMSHACRAAAAALALGCLLPWSARAQSDGGGAEPRYELGVIAPLLVSRVAPLYPEDARRDGVEGIVLVGALVGRDGRVRNARVVSSIPALDEQALVAARRFQFTSPRRDGLDCEAWVLVPVPFGDYLPHGGRLQQAEPTTADSGATAEFWQHVAEIQKAAPGPPGADAAEQHERLMSESLALEQIPQPGDEALVAFARGDTLGGKGTPEARRQARASWADAAQLSPWWPAPYLRLSAALIADRDYAGAERCARIVLAGRPNDAEASALLRRATQGRLGDASVHLKHK